MDDSVLAEQILLVLGELCSIAILGCEELVVRISIDEKETWYTFANVSSS